MRPKKTILFVDDNEQALSIPKFLLETRGYRVLTAQSAEQALILIEGCAPGGLDLIISDLLMPQIDGNELIRRAKEIAPSVPTMLVSGSVKAFERGVTAYAFLPKGACAPVEMLERIRVLVARKRGPKKAVMPQDATAYGRGGDGALASNEAVAVASWRRLSFQLKSLRSTDTSGAFSIAATSLLILKSVNNCFARAAYPAHCMPILTTPCQA